MHNKRHIKLSSTWSNPNCRYMCYVYMLYSLKGASGMHLVTTVVTCSGHTRVVLHLFVWHGDANMIRSTAVWRR